MVQHGISSKPIIEKVAFIMSIVNSQTYLINSAQSSKGAILNDKTDSKAHGHKSNISENFPLDLVSERDLFNSCRYFDSKVRDTQRMLELVSSTSSQAAFKYNSLKREIAVEALQISYCLAEHNLREMTANLMRKVVENNINDTLLHLDKFSKGRIYSRHNNMDLELKNNLKDLKELNLNLEPKKQ